MTMAMAPHWTDDVTSFPIFDTVIDARGTGGNIFAVLAAAMAYMRELDIPSDRREALRDRVSPGVSDRYFARDVLGVWFVF